MSSLTHLTNGELLRYAHVSFDPLAATDLEAELLKRLEDLDAQDEALEILAEHGVQKGELSWLQEALTFATYTDSIGGISNARALLEEISMHGIDTREALKTALTRISKFDALMDDLFEPLAALQALANTN